MARLKKRIRKAAGRVLRSKIVQDVIEDLITAAILTAAAKFSQSKTAAEAVRRTQNLVEKPKENKNRKRKAAGRKRLRAAARGG